MNLLPWMTLVFLLLAGSSFADVDVNWLTRIVIAIRKEYRINGQFCLAANIPLNHDPDKLSEVLQNDSYVRQVNNTLSGGGVYRGSSVVVAEPAGAVHAEARVLSGENLQQLISNREDHFLLIYSYLSPCGGKCTNPNNRKYNILKDIEKNVIPYWNDGAFVFTKVFDKPKYGPAPTKEELEQSLIQLGNTDFGLRNIFRCYKPQNLEFQCYSCSSHHKVAKVCVENTQERSRSADSFFSGKRPRINQSDSSSGKKRSRSADSFFSGKSPRMNQSDSSSSSSSSRSSRSSSRSSNRSSNRSSSRSSNRSSSRSSSRSTGSIISGKRPRMDQSDSNSRSRSRSRNSTHG